MPTSSLGGAHAPFWSEQLNGFVAKRHEKHMNQKLAQSAAKRRPQSAGPGGRSCAATAGVANLATTVAWGETDPATRSPPKAAVTAPAEKAVKKASHGLPLPLGNSSHTNLAALREAAEALAVENRQLKEHNNSLRALDSVRNTATQKLEQKLRKAHKQVATLLEGRGDHSRAAVADIRKDNEKQLVVSRLREQVEALEALVEERDHALATLQRSLSATAVAEVEAARDEYFHEVQRLQDAKAASEAALSAESADLRQQVHLLTAARRTAAMSGGGGQTGDSGGSTVGGGGVGSVGGVPAAAAAAVAEVAALKAHVRGLEADAEQHRLEVKKLQSESARLASAEAARAAELARGAEARAAAKTVAAHAHSAASPFTAQRAAEQALQRRKVRRNADRARDSDFPFGRSGGNGGGGGISDGSPADLLAFAGLGDLDDDLDALVLGRPFASGQSSSSQRAGKTSSSSGGAKSGGAAGIKKKVSKKRTSSSSSSAAALGGHPSSSDGHSLASNSSSGPLNSASKLRAAAAAAADKAAEAVANSTSKARKPGVPSQGQSRKAKLMGAHIGASSSASRGNHNNNNLSCSNGSSPAKQDARRGAKAQQREEAARVYEAAKLAALAGVHSNYESDDGNRNEDDDNDEESRAAASAVRDDPASMPQSPLWPLEPMVVGGSTVVLRAGDEEAPEGAVSEGASSLADSLKHVVAIPPSRAAAAAESAAAASREAAALAAVQAPVPKAGTLPAIKAPTPLPAAAPAAAKKLVLVGEPLECFFKVVPTVEDPGAVVRQLQGLRLPGCVFDDDYVVVGGDVLGGEKGHDGDGLAGPAGGENGGRADGSREVVVVLRCLAWDAENSAPGSGYTRVHRGVNRATLTLPPGALTFGFVDKLEHFTAQDWRRLTGQASSSSVAPPSPLPTEPQPAEPPTPLEDRRSVTEASSPPYSPPPVLGGGSVQPFAPFSPKAAGFDSSAMPFPSSNPTASSQVDDAEGYGSDDFNGEEDDDGDDVVADKDSVSDVVGNDVGGGDDDVVADGAPTEQSAEELPEEVGTDKANSNNQKNDKAKEKQQELRTEALHAPTPAAAAAPQVTAMKASPTNELDELRARSDAAEAAAKADARARAAAEVSRLQRELAAQAELKQQQAVARQQEAAATAAAKAAQALSAAKATKAAEEAKEKKEKEAATAAAAEERKSAAAEEKAAAEAKKAQKAAAADREAAAQEELARELAEEEEQRKAAASSAAAAATAVEVKAPAAPLAEMSIGSPADQSRGVATEASTKYDDEFDDDGDEYGDDFEDEGQ